MNAEGSDCIATATATGHRDPKSLLSSYVRPSNSLKMKAARTVGATLANLTGKKHDREDDSNDHDEDTNGSDNE
jgi:hypothetical protein